MRKVEELQLQLWALAPPPGALASLSPQSVNSQQIIRALERGARRASGHSVKRKTDDGWMQRCRNQILMGTASLALPVRRWRAEAPAGSTREPQPLLQRNCCQPLPPSGA